MNLGLSKIEILFIVAIYLTTLLAAVLFAALISVEMIFGLEFEALVTNLISPMAVLFLLVAPLPIVLITHLSRNSEKGKVIAESLGASIAGLAIANLAFPGLQGFLVLQIAYLISIPLMVENAALNFLELKKWISARAAASTVKKSVMLVSVGLIVLSAMVILPQQEKFIDKVESKVLMSAIEQNGLQEQVTDSISGLLVQSQRAQMTQIVGLPTFGALEESGDENARTFFLQMTALKAEIDKPEFAESVKEQMASQQPEMESGSLLDIAKQSMPEIELAERFAWLIFGMSLIMVFSFVSTIIIVPLSMLYSALLGKLLPGQQAAKGTA